MHSSRLRTVRSSGRLCSRGCLLLGGGACSRVGGCLLPGGAWSWGSQHALRQTPPVDRMTDRWKNITFATSLRTVTRKRIRFVLRLSVSQIITCNTYTKGCKLTDKCDRSSPDSLIQSKIYLARKFLGFFLMGH